MISSVRADGTNACMTIDSPTDGDVFLAFTEKVLVPSLRPGDIVIMDNLGAHKIEAVATQIAKAGATLAYLPAYSPDLNPIEKMWIKIKEFLLATKARTSEALDAAIAAAFQSVTSQDAVSWFASCGYTIKQNALGCSRFVRAGRDLWLGEEVPDGPVRIPAKGFRLIRL